MTAMKQEVFPRLFEAVLRDESTLELRWIKCSRPRWMGNGSP
jgi:hypothetical protein